MIISAEARIPFPRDLVYATYRDKLVDLIPYLPNVRQIEIKSRRSEGGLTKFVNEWHGGGEIPVMARAVISETMLSWTDFATWHDSEFITNWRIETHAFTEAVNCAGKHRFLNDGNGTLIESRGELSIDARQIKGIPPFFADKVGQTVEDFLSQKIAPNLLQVSEGVRQYLEHQRRQGVIN